MLIVVAGGASFWDLFDTDDLDTLEFCDRKITMPSSFYNVSEATDFLQQSLRITFFAMCHLLLTVAFRICKFHFVDFRYLYSKTH